MAKRTATILVEVEVETEGFSNRAWDWLSTIKSLMDSEYISKPYSTSNDNKVTLLSVDKGSLRDKSSGDLIYTTGELIRQDLERQGVSLYTYMVCAEKGIKEYDE